MRMFCPSSMTGAIFFFGCQQGPRVRRRGPDDEVAVGFKIHPLELGGRLGWEKGDHPGFGEAEIREIPVGCRKRLRLFSAQTHRLRRVFRTKHLDVFGHALVALLVPLGNRSDLAFRRRTPHLGRPHLSPVVVGRNQVDIRHTAAFDHLAFEHGHQRPADPFAFDHHPVVRAHAADGMVEKKARPQFKILLFDHDAPRAAVAAPVIVTVRA